MSRFFNGTTNYLNSATTPVSAMPMSMAAWGMPRGLSSTPHTLLGVYASGTDHTLSLDVTQNSGTARACAGTNSESVAVSTVGGATPVWNHYAAVFTSATNRAAYFNGGNKGASTTSRSPTVDHLTLGASNRNGGLLRYWDGWIAHAAIWNVALTDAEVFLLAQGVLPYLVRRDGLVGYWPMKNG